MEEWIGGIWDKVVRRAAHRAAVDLGQAEAGVVGGDHDIGGAADADAAAEHEAMHRGDHRHLVQVHRLEGGVVAGVDRDDQALVGVELLDVDAGAEAPVLSPDDQHAHVGARAQRGDGIGQCMPAGAVERVDGCAVENELNGQRDLVHLARLTEARTGAQRSAQTCSKRSPLRCNNAAPLRYASSSVFERSASMRRTRRRSPLMRAIAMSS